MLLFVYPVFLIHQYQVLIHQTKKNRRLPVVSAMRLVGVSSAVSPAVRL